VAAEEFSSAQKPVGAANFVGTDACSVQSKKIGSKTANNPNCAVLVRAGVTRQGHGLEGRVPTHAGMFVAMYLSLLTLLNTMASHFNPLPAWRLYRGQNRPGGLFWCVLE
jgi:hypothetical protein